jgi:hypothetical protein
MNAPIPTRKERIDSLAGVLALYAILHAILTVPYCLMASVFLIETGGRAWENDMVSDGILGGLIGVPLFVGLPCVAARSLWKRRPWAKALVIATVVPAFLFGVSFVRAGFIESIPLILAFAFPHLAFGVYSLWFVLHTPPVDQGSSKAE